MPVSATIVVAVAVIGHVFAHGINTMARHAGPHGNRRTLSLLLLLVDAVRPLRDKVDRPFARSTVLIMRGAGYQLDTAAGRGLRLSYLLGGAAGV